jgi:hypothetical protein
LKNHRLGWVALLLVCDGCARVRPWQREQLAQPIMQLDLEPYGEAQTRSMLEITEGATFGGGASGEVGAGCGCH